MCHYNRECFIDLAVVCCGRKHCHVLMVVVFVLELSVLGADEKCRVHSSDLSCFGISSVRVKFGR